MNTSSTIVTATFTASLKSHYYGWKKVFSASADSKSEFEEKFNQFALDHSSSLGIGTRSLDADEVREEIKNILDNDGDLSMAKAMVKALIEDSEGWFALLDDPRFEAELKVFESEAAMEAAMDANRMEIAVRDLYEAEGNHQGRTRSLEVDAWVTVRHNGHEFVAKFKEDIDDLPNYDANDIDCDEATEDEREAIAEALNEAINGMAE